MTDKFGGVLVPNSSPSSKDNTNKVFTAKDFAPDWAQGKMKVQQYTDEISPGAWTTIEFIVAPATVDDLKNLRISIDLNELSLPATQTEQ